MADPSPREFGWTPLVGLVQIFMAALTAVLGFRTFAKWKREKLEEQKILLAAEAVSLAYEARAIFAHIRECGEEITPDVFTLDKNDEWRRLVHLRPKKRVGEKSKYFAATRRIRPKLMAFFGPDKEACFKKIERARDSIVSASDTLARVNPSLLAERTNTGVLYNTIFGGPPPGQDPILSEIGDAVGYKGRPWLIDGAFGGGL